MAAFRKGKILELTAGARKPAPALFLLGVYVFEPIDKGMRSRVDIDDLSASVKYKRVCKANPTYFEPDGILVFVGRRGAERRFRLSGTCLTFFVPFRMQFFAQMSVYGLPESVRYVPYTGLIVLDRYNNGFEGVIF